MSDRYEINGRETFRTCQNILHNIDVDVKQNVGNMRQHMVQHIVAFWPEYLCRQKLVSMFRFELSGSGTRVTGSVSEFCFS